MPSLKEIYLMPFHALAAATRVFIRNRDRTKAFLSQPKVAATAKYAMLATLVIWLGIALLNRDKDDGRLSEAMRTLWSTNSGDNKPDSTTSPDAARAGQ